MSCALIWRPVVTAPIGYADGVQLREILDRKYGFPYTLNFNDRNYLEALVDAGIPNAQELLSDLYKYGEIRIDVEF